MDKDKLIKELKKILKQKYFGNLLIGTLVLGFLLLSLSVIGPQLSNMGILKSNNNVNKTEKNNIDSDKSATTYEEQQKRELKGILEQITGVGKAEVLISYEGGEGKEVAIDKNTQTTVTEETDTDGGKRVNNQKNDGTKVVMSNDNGKNEPFILKTIKPKVISVMVVAEGAENSKLRYDIVKAVANLYDLSLDKVNVYPMED